METVAYLDATSAVSRNTQDAKLISLLTVLFSCVRCAKMLEVFFEPWKFATRERFLQKAAAACFNFVVGKRRKCKKLRREPDWVVGRDFFFSEPTIFLRKRNICMFMLQVWTISHFFLISKVTDEHGWLGMEGFPHRKLKARSVDI